MTNQIQKPLTLQVSATKHQSLQKQLEIISHALIIFKLEASQDNREQTKADTLELVRMLDELTNPPQKTSRFNVVAKSSKRTIAKNVTFAQAKKYHNCILKFSGMCEAGS